MTTDLTTGLNALLDDGTIRSWSLDGRVVAVVLPVNFLNGEPYDGMDEASQARLARVESVVESDPDTSFLDGRTLEPAADGQGLELWTWRLPEPVEVIPAGTWRCSDADVAGTDLDIEADSAREAAEEYVSSGDFEPRERTCWIRVRCESADDSDLIKVAIEPIEPKCEAGHAHAWRDGEPSGSGGGRLYIDTCRRCGVRRSTDTWASDPADGEQGLTQLAYLEADEDFQPDADLEDES
jgi:hypothetical protein